MDKEGFDWELVLRDHPVEIRTCSVCDARFNNWNSYDEFLSDIFLK